MISSIRIILLVIGLVLALPACTTDQLTAFSCTFDNDPMMPRSPECLAIDRQQDESARRRRLEREAEKQKQKSALDFAREGLQAHLESLTNTTLVGTYSCGQGKTGGRLETGRIQRGVIPSVFYFYPDESNPGVPSGSYHMDLSVVASTRIASDGHEYAGYDVQIHPIEWIERPDGYIMVPMDGQLGSTRTRPYRAVIKGRIEAEGCNDFELTEILQ